MKSPYENHPEKGQIGVSFRLPIDVKEHLDQLLVGHGTKQVMFAALTKMVITDLSELLKDKSIDDLVPTIERYINERITKII